jgi:hypothetical protein
MQAMDALSIPCTVTFRASPAALEEIAGIALPMIEGLLIVMIPLRRESRAARLSSRGVTTLVFIGD